MRVLTHREWVEMLAPWRMAGANGPPPPMTFEPHDTLWSNGIMARHADDGRPLGHLHWHPSGEIDTVVVHPDFQRREIGSKMLQHAVDNPHIYQSTWPIHGTDQMTPAGRAFAKSHGHDLPDEEVHQADPDVQNWGWRAVDSYVPAHIPYTGQNEAEMEGHLTPGFHEKQQQQNSVVARRRIGGIPGAWPKKWQGKDHPDVPWDERWNPNHPEHQGQPWTNG